MAQRAGRLTCPRCGANNFDTVTACWKCSAPLSAGSAAPAAAMPASPYAPPERAPMAAPIMSPAVHYPVPAGDSGVARRAAIALALTFPWLGLPVGWIFMMIEDRSRQAIGRVCVIWSMIALVFHLLLMFVAMQSVRTVLMSTLDILKSVQQSQNEGGGGMGGGRFGGGIP
jgi:hypothetical protein